MSNETIVTPNLPTYSEREYHNGTAPVAPFAFIGPCYLFGYEGWYSVDLRDAYGAQTNYGVCPDRDHALRAIAANGGQYVVEAYCPRHK